MAHFSRVVALPFCVIPEPGGTLNDSNASRWQ
jgi:hypothetical protein